MSTFPINICIVDHDSVFVNFVADYLRLRGVNSAVFSSAEELLRDDVIAAFDFFILDLCLPGIDGVDLITSIRARSSSGILVVSGRLGADAFNSALAAGADMFVNKPARFDQIAHGIQSIWRRLPEPRVRSNAWTISADLIMVSPSGRKVPLSRAEGKLINRLIEQGTGAVTRADLADAAGISENSDQRNLDAALFRLRRKIEREAECNSPFRTVHGVGYQLIEKFSVQEVKRPPK